MRNTKVTLLALALVIGMVAVAGAQTETETQMTFEESADIFEIRNATVVTTYGNFLVLERENGEVFELEVPADWRFNVDGQELMVGDLEPGTKLSAAVKTTATARKVVTTTIRTGEVLHVQGRTVIVRAPEGVKKVRVPEDFIFYVDGKPHKVYDLKKGMEVTAVIISETAPVLLTEQELASEIVGTAPP